MLDEVTKYMSGFPVTGVSHIDSDISIQFRDVRLWVATSWRIEKDSVITIGSGNLVEYLSHEDYEDRYNSAVISIKACICGFVAEVKYSTFNEVILEFSNGHTFRTFQDFESDAEDDAENFQLSVPGARYLVYPKAIEFEKEAPFPSAYKLEKRTKL